MRNGSYEGWYQQLTGQAVPIEAQEPSASGNQPWINFLYEKVSALLVLLDVLYAACLIAQALGGHIAAQTLDELHCPAGDVLWECDHVDALQYEIVCLHGIGGTEWRSVKKNKNRLNI